MKRKLKPDKRFSLVPLKGKKPAVKWKKCQKKPVPLKSWNIDYDEVGLLTGKVNGILVIDADNKAAVKWCRWYLGNTHVQQSTTRGRHFFFKAEKGIKNSASKLYPGVDVRSHGGYVKIHDKTVLILLDKYLSNLPRIPKKIRKALKAERAAKKETRHRNSGNSFRVRELVSAVYAIDPDNLDYESWFRVAATLKAFLPGDFSWSVFWHWSDLARGKLQFPKEDRDYWWGTVQPYEFTRTVFKWANKNGWNGPNVDIDTAELKKRGKVKNGIQ